MNPLKERAPVHKELHPFLKKRNREESFPWEIGPGEVPTQGCHSVPRTELTRWPAPIWIDDCYDLYVVKYFDNHLCICTKGTNQLILLI